MGNTFGDFLTGIVLALFLLVLICFGFYLGTEKVVDDCAAVKVVRIHEIVVDCSVRE